GGTIGRCPGNHLLLEEDSRVGRVQAVVRIKNDIWSMMSVSSRTDTVLNGQALPMLKEVHLALGDTLTIGDYLLRMGSSPVAESSAMKALPEEPPVAETTEAAQEDSTDIFKELLDGPGVLPVGQPADAGKLHPFELASQAPRHHPDPIQQLQDGHWYTPTYGDGACSFSLDTEPEQHNSHIFSNPTPSTLNLEDPLAPQRKNLIDEALAQGHTSTLHHENR